MMLLTQIRTHRTFKVINSNYFFNILKLYFTEDKF